MPELARDIAYGSESVWLAARILDHDEPGPNLRRCCRPIRLEQSEKLSPNSNYDKPENRTQNQEINFDASSGRKARLRFRAGKTSRHICRHD